MDERNRTMIVDGLVRGLKEGTSLVRSHRALEEFRTFRFDAKGKPDHEKGKHSDAIMAAGLAEYGRGQAGDMEQVDSVTGTPLREVPSLRELRERWNSGVGRADPYFGNRRWSICGECSRGGFDGSGKRAARAGPLLWRAGSESRRTAG